MHRLTRPDVSASCAANGMLVLIGGGRSGYSTLNVIRPLGRRRMKKTLKVLVMYIVAQGALGILAMPVSAQNHCPARGPNKVFITVNAEEEGPSEDQAHRNAVAAVVGNVKKIAAAMNVTLNPPRILSRLLFARDEKSTEGSTKYTKVVQSFVMIDFDLKEISTIDSKCRNAWSGTPYEPEWDVEAY